MSQSRILLPWLRDKADVGSRNLRWMEAPISSTLYLYLFVLNTESLFIKQLHIHRSRTVSPSVPTKLPNPKPEHCSLPPTYHHVFGGTQFSWRCFSPIGHIRTFGCAVQILIRKELRGGKFEPVSRDGVLLGFSDHNFNFIVLDLVTNKIIISHNVHFQELVFPFRKDSPIHIGELDQTSQLDPQPDPTPVTHPLADEDDEMTPIHPQPNSTPTIHPQADEDVGTTPLPVAPTYTPEVTAPVDTPNVPESIVEDSPAPPPPVKIRRSTRERHPLDRYTPNASPSIF